MARLTTFGDQDLADVLTLDREQARMFRSYAREADNDPFTKALLTRLGVAPGWQCLEVGGGRNASVARWLSDVVGPEGRVVMTELGRNAPTAPGVDVWTHDITSDDLPEQRFDLVLARFVLAHLPDRDQCLARMYAALRPGGWLLVEDADFSPYAGLSEPFCQAMCGFEASMVPYGTDYRWAATVPSALRRVGLVAVNSLVRDSTFSAGSLTAAFWASSLGHLRTRMPAEVSGTLDEVLDTLLTPSDRTFPDLRVWAGWGRRPA